MEDKKLVLVKHDPMFPSTMFDVYKEIEVRGIKVTFKLCDDVKVVETPNVRIEMIYDEFQLRGYKADQMWGFNDEERYLMLKDPHTLRSRGSIAKYVEEIEKSVKPEVKSTVRAIDAEKTVYAIEAKFGILRKVNYSHLIDEIEETIREQPTLEGFESGSGVTGKDENVNTSKWRDCAMGIYECPICEKRYSFKHHFCPNCGVKMTNS